MGATGMKIAHVINVFLDIDRETWVLNPEWIQQRVSIFERFTLASLRNQTDRDFTILVYRGNRFRDRVGFHDFGPDVISSYDYGKEFFPTLDADLVAITRVDSDDLLHKDAMAELKANVQSRPDPLTRIWRKGYTWDRNNRVISPYQAISGPFFTHVFPIDTVKNWKLFHSRHFVVHGQAGGRNPLTIELPENRICVVKHEQNISRIRRNLPLEIRPHEFYSGNQFILDSDVINSILVDFGMEGEIASCQSR